MPSEQRKPLWLYPNLLSFDAPWVAVAWLYVFAKTWLGYLPWHAYASLGLAVWSIYASDRLLDVAMKGGTAELEQRHRFHSDHRKAFAVGIAVALISGVVLVVTLMPLAIYTYLLFGLVLVAGFFGLSMLSSQDPGEVQHTKNIVAGVAFAYGTAMTAHVFRGVYGIGDLVGSHEFLCFAVLCILNISAIDLWEHAGRSSDREIRASDELALTLPLILLSCVSLFHAAFDEQKTSPPFFVAILTGAALLYILNRIRGLFSMDALRVLADVAVIAPVLVFVVLSRG